MGTFSHHHTQWASLPVGHNTENKPEATTRANGVPKGKNNAEGCPKEQVMVQHIMLKWQPEHSQIKLTRKFNIQKNPSTATSDLKEELHKNKEVC